MASLLTRRRLLTGFGCGAVGLVGVRLAVPVWMRPGPVRGVDELSEEARALVARAFEGLDLARVWDGHVHVVGLGAGGTGCWVSPLMRSHLHPIRRVQYDVYLAASGVRAEARADAEYLERLLALSRAANPAGKLLLLAFDWYVDVDGREVRGRSNFHVPDDYVLRLAEDHPEVRAIASIHPYRADAIERLDAAHERGAVGVKWLPNAMGIDPASPRCDPFYTRLTELDLPLVSHGGVEKAVHAEEDQELGNPLRLRRALDLGVRVVVAHSASLGSSRDLDATGEPPRSSFELFLRLMREPRYEGRVFGDLSAMTLVNRERLPLETLLSDTSLGGRLVNGSDYPLPAIELLISPRQLAGRDLLDPAERPALAELFDANPLLFDLVLKRRLRRITADGESRFPAAAFESARVFA